MRRIFINASLLLLLLLTSFAYAQARHPEDAFSFAVTGDNRSGDRIYKKIITAIMQRRPALVFNTGDIIPNPGNRAQWANFKALSRIITVPYYYAPGNHDIDDEKSQEVWREEVNFPGEETYYSVTHGNSLFVVLNSYEPQNELRIAGRQLAWLAHTLDPAKYEHQFVFIHAPLFLWQGATNLGRSLDKHPDARDALHRLFVQKKVDVVFEGHEHTYRRMDVDGIKYVVTGGGGAPLYGSHSLTPFNHFVLVTVKGRRVETKVIDRDGALRDEFVLTSER
ncbi:MAG: metallophosphoesterase [bacterium]